MVYSLLMIITMSLGTNFARIAGCIKPLENTQLDIMLGLNPLNMNNVKIVGITNYDYRAEFGSQSPLAPNKVSELIDLIGQGKPELIVVDLDTSDPRFKQMTMPKVSCPIIWGRTARDEDSFTNSKHFGLANGVKTANKTVPIFTLDPVLGQSNPPPDIKSGVAQIPVDADGVVRNYYRRFSVRGSDGDTVVGSLPWIAATEVNPELINKHTRADTVPLLYVSDPDQLSRISCADLRRVASKPAWKEVAQAKVVVLGGYYGAARDDFATPVGRMWGADLVAQAIDGELQKRMKQDAPLWLIILCQVGTGMFLAFLNCRFPSGIVACGGFLLIPVLSLGVGAMLLQTCSLWADFMPVLLVIQGQAFWNHLKTYQKMEIELKKLNAEKVGEKVGEKIAKADVAADKQAEPKTDADAGEPKN